MIIHSNVSESALIHVDNAKEVFVLNVKMALLLMTMYAWKMHKLLKHTVQCLPIKLYLIKALDNSIANHVQIIVFLVQCLAAMFVKKNIMKSKDNVLCVRIIVKPVQVKMYANLVQKDTIWQIYMGYKTITNYLVIVRNVLKSV